MLVLIPKTVNNKPFNLNLLKELIQAPKQGETKTTLHLYFYLEEVKAELGKISPENSYWVLMTKDIIPGSRNKTYDCQKELVHTKGRGSYELPSAIEAAASILMHYFKTGECLYIRDPETYTRCQKTVTGEQYPVTIGGFSSYVLDLRCYSGSNSNEKEDGVAAVRKF
ncbi:MAG: hypothetical protein P0S93_00870 [Candidatus Neptunochlamydia sp.]|nr:hypothetical protein [Candidatus Neptunochlamydia sp.]